jgi:DNA-binding NarL/FixJ family response regulator
MGVVDELARAREAYERRDWVRAYDLLSGAADTEGPAPTAHDFGQLATAAYLLGRHNDCVQALQRAYQGHLGADRRLDAVRAGFWLAMVLLEAGEDAVSSGWAARSQRLLDEVAEDVVEQGYLLTHTMMRRIFAGELAPALDLALEVTSYGRRFKDPNLLANGLNAQGRMLLYAGQVPEGLALLDEAMIGLSTGEVSPLFAGQIYCSLIEACQEVSDLGRMTQWTRALTSWVDAQPGLIAFAGQCAVHRGQIMRMQGAYVDALDELARAAERYLAAGTPAPAGIAYAECGEVRRIRGELDAADGAYEQASSYGFEPQPGLALLWLARGRTAAAVNAVRRLLDEPRDPVHRSQLLPGAVEVLLETGRVEAAAAASDELTALADAFGCEGLRGHALHARAQCLLAADEPAAAATAARAAEGVWRGLTAPYEVARAQVLLGRALRQLGDEDSATSELARARRTFQDLGARPAEQVAAGLLRPGRPSGLTEREVEVLRLVASGRSNPEIAAALVLSDKTVARHLSNIFTKLDVSSRTAAAAYAFENRLL